MVSRKLDIGGAPPLHDIRHDTHAHMHGTRSYGHHTHRYRLTYRQTSIAHKVDIHTYIRALDTHTGMHADIRRYITHTYRHTHMHTVHTHKHTDVHTVHTDTDVRTYT